MNVPIPTPPVHPPSPQGGPPRRRGPKIALGAVGGVLALGSLALAFDVNGVRSQDLARYRMESQYGREDGDQYLEVMLNPPFQWTRRATSLRLSRGGQGACQATFGLRMRWNGAMPLQREHQVEVRIPAGRNADVIDEAVVRIDGARVQAQGAGSYLEWPLPEPENLGTAEVRIDLTESTSPEVRSGLGFPQRGGGCGFRIVRRHKDG